MRDNRALKIRKRPRSPFSNLASREVIEVYWERPVTKLFYPPPGPSIETIHIATFTMEEAALVQRELLQLLVKEKHGS